MVVTPVRMFRFVLMVMAVRVHMALMVLVRLVALPFVRMLMFLAHRLFTTLAAAQAAP